MLRVIYRTHFVDFKNLHYWGKKGHKKKRNEKNEISLYLYYTAKVSGHFRFYTYCRTSIEIFNNFYSTFRNIKNMFSLIYLAKDSSLVLLGDQQQIQ